MTDRFADFQPSLSGPASTGFTVVPDDGTDLPEATRALYVGMGGNLAVTMLSGAEFVLTGLPDGSLLPLRAVRVRATGTTAGAIVGLA